MAGEKTEEGRQPKHRPKAEGCAIWIWHNSFAHTTTYGRRPTQHQPLQANWARQTVKDLCTETNKITPIATTLKRKTQDRTIPSKQNAKSRQIKSSKGSKFYKLLARLNISGCRAAESWVQLKDLHVNKISTVPLFCLVC
jgi:hypothetical protein